MFKYKEIRTNLQVYRVSLPQSYPFRMNLIGYSTTNQNLRERER